MKDIAPLPFFQNCPTLIFVPCIWTFQSIRQRMSSNTPEKTTHFRHWWYLVEVAEFLPPKSETPGNRQ